MISAIPHESYSSVEQLSAEIDKWLSAVWEGLLPENEKRRWSSCQPGQPELSPAVLDRLDELILKQAETFGWRLVLSGLVHSRFAAWSLKRDGPELFVRLGKALAKSARILQGLEPPPVDPGLYLFKRGTVRELHEIMRSLRTDFSVRAITPTRAIEAFRRIVNSETFPHVRANLDSWIDFFRHTDARHLRKLSLAERIAPAELFDAWRAWGTRYEQETLRQKISKLGRVFNAR